MKHYHFPSNRVIAAGMLFFLGLACILGAVLMHYSIKFKTEQPQLLSFDIDEAAAASTPVVDPTPVQAVLGFKTLPSTGGNDVNLLPLIVLGFSAIMTSFVMLSSKREE